MAGGSSVAVVMLMMWMLFVGSPNYIAVVEGMSCGEVSGDLASCVAYLTGGGLLDASCCNGVKKLNSAARTTADRRTACRCLVAASKAISGVNLGLAAALPAKCGVNIPYKISPSTDCNKVN